jgi:hypothetical protein
MSWQDIAIGLLVVVSGAGGWFMKTIWSAVESLRTGLTELEKSLPNVYARRDDVRDMFDQVLQGINRLHEEIRQKADK